MKVLDRSFFVLCIFFSDFIYAAQTVDNIAGEIPKVDALALGSGQHLLTVLVALLGIIALIFVFAWFARRFNGGSWLKESHIKVLSSLPLGTRERLLLVEVGQQQLLLGVTANTISTLHTLQEPITINEPKATSDFSEKLLAMIDRQNTYKNTNKETLENEK